MNAIEKYRGIIYKGVELKQLKSGLCNKIKSKKNVIKISEIHVRQH